MGILVKSSQRLMSLVDQLADSGPISQFRLWWDEGGRHFFIVCHLPSEIFPATTRRAVARTTGSSLLTTSTSSAAASDSEATDSANEAATKQLEIEYDADDEEGKLILPREVVSFREEEESDMREISVSFLTYNGNVSQLSKRISLILDEPEEDDNNLLLPINVNEKNKTTRELVNEKIARLVEESKARQKRFSTNNRKQKLSHSIRRKPDVVVSDRRIGTQADGRGCTNEQ